MNDSFMPHVLRGTISRALGVGYGDRLDIQSVLELSEIARAALSDIFRGTDALETVEKIFNFNDHATSGPYNMCSCELDRLREHLDEMIGHVNMLTKSGCVTMTKHGEAK